MKQRILFVDDEKQILSGLKRMLRPYSKEWEVVVATSGPDALELMQQNDFDCVVSDMKMPGMNGADFLNEVHKQYPNVARFILSGHAEMEPIMQALPVTHQYLSKPCEPADLVEVVKRACNLQKLINNEELKTAIGQVECLPARPGLFAQLTCELSDEHSSMESISQIVEQDPAITAKLLKIVNSAFFGLAQTTSSIKDAISYLGVSSIKSIILSEEMFKNFNTPIAIPGFCLEEEFKITNDVAKLSWKIFEDKKLREEIFLAAMLHRAGCLVMAQHMSDKLAQVIAEHAKGQSSLNDIEESLIGCTHDKIGAYLLELWGLPYSVVEAVAFHSTPWEVKHSQFQAVDGLYIAKTLLEESKQGCDDLLNIDYLTQLGCADKIDQWRQIAQQGPTH